MTTKVGNRYPQLVTTIDEYAELINKPLDELDIVNLWALGNALLAQAISFEKQDKNRTITEPLEPTHLALLIEVAGMHGGFILGFPSAIELSERADAARLGSDVVSAIREPASNVLASLSRQRRLVSERARQLADALDAALVAVEWDVARVGYTSYATLRNALIAIGKSLIWLNDKGGTVVGGTILGSAIAAANLPPGTLELVVEFLNHNSSQILTFAAPFPELRAYMQWLIGHLEQREKSPNK